MKNTRKISVVLVFAMLISMFAPASYALAASDPYLAYQTTEYGAQVNRLGSLYEMERYRVDKLLLNQGDKVDLCFINAGKWKNAKWTSSNEKVVKVDKAGVVTAITAGTAKVTLTYKQNKLLGKNVSVTIDVCVGENSWGVELGQIKD